MADQVEVKAESEFKELILEDESKEFIKHLIEENKFLRNMISELINLNKLNRLQQRPAIPSKKLEEELHEVTDVSEARFHLEEHFNTLASKESNKDVKEPK